MNFSSSSTYFCGITAGVLSKFIYFYMITKSLHVLWLVNQLWFIVVGNSWKNHVSFELLYESNRPQVSMVYRLLNPLGCSKNSWRIWKSLACSLWFTNSSRVLWGQKTSARLPVPDEYSLISNEWIYKSTMSYGMSRKLFFQVLLRSEE